MLSILCEVEMKQQYCDRSDLLVPSVQDPIMLLDLNQRHVRSAQCLKLSALSSPPLSEPVVSVVRY